MSRLKSLIMTKGGLRILKGMIFLSSMLLFSYSIIYAVSLTKYRTERDNYSFVSTDVLEYLNLNKTGLPTVYLDEIGLTLFFLSHGAYVFESYLNRYLSLNRLEKLKESKEGFFLVGINPIKKKMGPYFEDGYIKLIEKKTFVLQFNDDEKIQEVFIILSKDSEQYMITPDSENLNESLLRNRISYHREGDRMIVTALEPGFGIKICYEICTNYWDLNINVRVEYLSMVFFLGSKSLVPNIAPINIYLQSNDSFIAKYQSDERSVKPGLE